MPTAILSVHDKTGLAQIADVLQVLQNSENIPGKEPGIKGFKPTVQYDALIAEYLQQ